MTDREVMQMALEALEADNSKLWPSDKRSIAIEALRARLAEPEPEPVAWMYEARHIDSAWVTAVSLKHPGPEDRYVRGVQPLYTTPPTRRPLTPVAIAAMWRKFSSEEGFTTAQFVCNFARAIEAAHGIKEAK